MLRNWRKTSRMMILKRMIKEGQLVERVSKNPYHILRKLELPEQRSKDLRQVSLVKKYL